MQSHVIKREIAIATALFAAGLLLLPPAIYWVGRQLVGDYAGGGLLALADQIWSDLLQLEPAAWVLVLSPYVLLQLVRLIRRTWRARPV
ncbi:MAG: hypothetical protein ACREFI_00580 [Stellaceae bacterium]